MTQAKKEGRSPSKPSGSVAVDVFSLMLDLTDIAGFIGFGSYIAAFLCLFLVPFGLDGSGVCALLQEGIGALSFMAAFFAYRLCAQRIGASKALPLVIISGIGAAAALVEAVPLMGAYPGINLMLFILMCAGSAAQGMIWFVSLCKQKGRMLIAFIALGLCLGVALGFGVSLLEVSAARLALGIITAVAFILALTTIKLQKDLFTSSITNKDSDKRSRIRRASTVMLSSCFFELGFVLAYAPRYDGLWWCLGTSACVCLVLFVDALWHQAITERSLSPLTPPLTVMAFMVLFMFEGPLRVLALCAITSLIAVFCASGWAAMVEHVRLSNLSPYRVYAKARTVDFGGFAIGVILGAVAFQLPQGYAACLGVIIAGAFCLLAFFSHKPRYPESGFERPSSEAEVKSSPRSSWRLRCKAVSEKYGLSERQQEILLLLTQGRNAKYIEAALVISLSTVQTHIRNIYRKVGVHSRQELIDVIESTKLYGDE